MSSGVEERVERVKLSNKWGELYREFEKTWRNIYGKNADVPLRKLHLFEAGNNFQTAYAQFDASFGTVWGNYLMNGYGILWRLFKKTHNMKIRLTQAI